MKRFDKNNRNELKEYLYNSCVHDAILEKVEYGCNDDSVQIELYNPIFRFKINMTFRCMKVALAIKCAEFGCSSTVNSLTMEDDYSYLYTYISTRTEFSEGSFYLLFQMFSGDELHIVCEEVFVETEEV